MNHMRTKKAELLRRNQIEKCNCSSEFNFDKSKISDVDKNIARETSLERKERKERHKIREERRRDREKERRLEEAGVRGHKHSKASRDSVRDISERVALGMAHNPVTHGVVKYDQRLFNQDAMIQPGFNTEDGYNPYDKPLFARP